MNDNHLDLLTATLKELQSAGLVAPFIDEAIVEMLPDLQEWNEYGSLWETIVGHCFELLTQAGRDAESRRLDESRGIIVLNGVEPRGPDDEPATQAQIGFLKTLGVRDASTLDKLGRWQAGLPLSKS